MSFSTISWPSFDFKSTAMLFVAVEGGKKPAPDAVSLRV
jgi:hypothetical protein